MTVALVVATTAARDRVFGPANGTAQGGTRGAVSASSSGAAQTGSGGVRPAGDAGAVPAGSGGAGPVGDAGAIRPGDVDSSETRDRRGANGATPVRASTALRAAAALPLPGLHGGEVTTQPLLSRLCGQLSGLGVTDIVLIAPPGDGDMLATMAWDGLSLSGSLRGEGPAGAGNVNVIECASVAEELGAVASVARHVAASGDAVLCCAGDVVAHTEALARVCGNTHTSALTTARVGHEAANPDLRPALRLARRDRLSVVAAGSAFHRVSAPNAVGCGVLFVSPRDGGELAAVAEEFTLLAGGDSSTHKGKDGRPAEPGGRHAGGEEADHAAASAAASAAAVPVTRQAVTSPAHGHKSGFTDSMALLLVGLVRSGVAVEAVDIGPLVCMRAQTADQARAAAAELSGVDEDRIRLNAAAGRGGGLLARCLVDPYVKHFARWAHRRRRLHPNALTGMSFGLGALAALWFSAGSAAGMILGAVFGLAAFALGRAGGQLARYARAQTPFGTWLDAILGRLSEYAVYAGLAAGAVGAAAAGAAGAAGVTGAGKGAIAAITPPLPRGAWELAVVALILQALRDTAGLCARAYAARTTMPIRLPRGALRAASHGGSGQGVISEGHRILPFDEPADFAVSASGLTAAQGSADAADLAANVLYGARATRHHSSGRLARLAGRSRRVASRAVRWMTEIIGFQPGERVAVIGLTAIVAGARMTFVVLLAWGLVAAVVACLTVLARPPVPSRRAPAPTRARAPFARNDREVVTYRDDGIVAKLLGRFVNGQLPPFPPALAGVTVTIILCTAGIANTGGAIVLAPVVAMALAALGSMHAHDRRLDWLVPPLLQLGEYVFLVALALAHDVPLPVLFILICAIAAHHHDAAYSVPPGPARARRRARGARAGVLRVRAAAGLGWEGRMLAAAIGAMLGIEVFAFAVLAVYLWVLFGWQSLTGWMGTTHGTTERMPRRAFRGAGDLPARTGSWGPASTGRQPPRWPGAPGPAGFEDGGGR